jgi:hypothetical protein
MGAMSKRKAKAACAGCAAVRATAAAIQSADAKRILNLQFDVLDAEKALETTRRALVDLWAFYQRVAASKSEWTAADVRRLEEIRRQVDAVAQILGPPWSEASVAASVLGPPFSDQIISAPHRGQKISGAKTPSVPGNNSQSTDREEQKQLAPSL